MIFKLVIGCFLSALLLFLAAQTLSALSLATLAGPLFKLGSVLLLFTFIVLVLYAMISIVAISFNSLINFFSAPRRHRRRLLFAQADHDRVTRLFHLQSAAIKYHHGQHRKRLNEANDIKHFRSLSKSIYENLLAMRLSLTESDFNRLKNEHARHHNNFDLAALLILQQQMTELTRAQPV